MRVPHLMNSSWSFENQIFIRIFAPHFAYLKAKGLIFICKFFTYMFKNQYETVFILTPVLSDAQMKDAVEKFKKVLTDNGAELLNEESWGLRKLAYPIQHKSTGYYQFFEFTAPGELVKTLEIEYKRDERIMRFLTTKLDKYGVDYAERRRKGQIGKKKETEAK